MTITIPSKVTIMGWLQAFLKARKPSMSTSVSTDWGSRAVGLVEAIYGLFTEASNVEKDIFATTASDAALVEHAKTRLALNPRKGTTVSSGTDVLRVYGTLAATAKIGESLAHTDGTRYKLMEAVTIPAGLYVDVSIESISKGTICNKSANEILTFEMPPSGITSDAVLQGALTGGLDIESFDELRSRLIDAYQNPPAGGRNADYKAWALGIDSVYRAYIYSPNSNDGDSRRGDGTIDVVFTKLGDAGDRVPGAALITTVQDELDDQRPSLSDVEAMAPGTTSQNLDLRIIPHAGYDFDWTGSDTVDSYNSTTKTITWITSPLPTTLTAKLDAGTSVRIMCTNQVLIVLSYSGVTTIISETPTTNPSNGDPIYPAGPCSQDALDATKDYMNDLGPAKGTAGDPEQLNWDDVLRIARLCDEVIDSHIGIKDIVPVTPDPTTDWTKTPTDPGDPSPPNMFIFGDIKIRP